MLLMVVVWLIIVYPTPGTVRSRREPIKVVAIGSECFINTKITLLPLVVSIRVL